MAIGFRHRPERMRTVAHPFPLPSGRRRRRVSRAAAALFLFPDPAIPSPSGPGNDGVHVPNIEASPAQSRLYKSNQRVPEMDAPVYSPQASVTINERTPPIRSPSQLLDCDGTRIE